MITGIRMRLRSLWRGLRPQSRVDAEMNEEFRQHLELRTADLVRAGLSPNEAARQARVEFGSTEYYGEVGRESRGLHRFDDLRLSWLDFKLGFRMLARYPGLTLIGGLAMAFAIWVGAGTFELVRQVVRPALPLDDGDRIVGFRQWDAAAGRAEDRIAHDFVQWKRAVTSVEHLGAFTMLRRNLLTPDGRAAPVDVVEMSASGFEVARVRPLLGRALATADERPDAAPVVVIGYDLWQSRFAGDVGAVGQTVRVGGVHSTVVGVMPKGFEFPVNNNFWAPLRLKVAELAPRDGPAMHVFGRLAPGVSLSEAGAELTTIGRRTAIDFKETHEHLRPQVLSYAKSILDVSGWRKALTLSLNLPVILLVVLICANVALLMFARAATREAELVVRNALGASRRRIVMQLFAEALVLGSIAAVIGLAAAGFGLRWAMAVIEGELLNGTKLPFWFTGELSPITLMYTMALTLIAAVIAGVLPGLKATRAVGERLKATSVGSGGLRFGGVWTAVIVSQIAVTVAFPVVTLATRMDARTIKAINVGVPDEEYLTVRLEMDRENASGELGELFSVRDRTAADAEFTQRFREAYRELETRLTADPAVVGVAFADRLPRMYHPHRIIRIDAGGAAPLHRDYPQGYRISSASVGPTFFDVFRAPILNGRRFHLSDHETNQKVVVVNESFVKLVLGGRNPIGRRFQFVSYEERDPEKPGSPPPPWYEIVGVVRDMGMGRGNDPKVAGVYHPAAAGDLYPVQLAVHVNGDPATFASKLQAIGVATDPTMRLHGSLPMSRINDAELEFLDFWFRMLLLVSAIALALSLAGIYSVMAFTVTRRTREIGVRVALGGDRRHVLLAVFRRPLIQVMAGVFTGATIIWGILVMASASNLPLKGYAMIAAYALVMLGICSLACIVPTRRALRIQPTEALRAEG